jgi:uncharacterized protein (DUF885 family)
MSAAPCISATNMAIRIQIEPEEAMNCDSMDDFEQATAEGAEQPSSLSKEAKFTNRRIAALKAAHTRRDQQLLELARHALAALKLGRIKTVEKDLYQISLMLNNNAESIPPKQAGLEESGGQHQRRA